MGWLVESLANVFLELLGDIMSMAIVLVVDLDLDIGMPARASGGGIAPAIGSFIDPTKAQGLLERTFPDIGNFALFFLTIGMSLVFFQCITKLIIAMGGPFTQSEDPGTIAIRTIMAGVGVWFSYSFFMIFEVLFTGIYGKFMKQYKESTKGAENYILMFEEKETDTEWVSRKDGGEGSSVQSAEDAFSMFGKDLIKEYSANTFALCIVEIILFSILLTAFIKLMLEIYERYVVLGVMFYMAPLAFSTIVSKNSKVFSSYVQMVFCELIVMCSNLFFTGVFISAWYKLLSTKEAYLFNDTKSFAVTMLIMIAWLITGTQIDQHLKGLGLATAQTGQRFGGAIMAGVGTGLMAAGLAARTVTGGAKLAGKAATGQTGIQKAMRDHTGIFSNGGGGGGGGTSERIKGMDAGNEAGGIGLMKTLGDEYGENKVGRAIAASGANPNAIDHSTLSTSADGRTISGRDTSGNEFQLGITDSGGLYAMNNDSMAEKNARAAAESHPAGCGGNPDAKWEAKPQYNSAGVKTGYALEATDPVTGAPIKDKYDNNIREPIANAQIDYHANAKETYTFRNGSGSVVTHEMHKTPNAEDIETMRRLESKGYTRTKK